MARVCKRNPGDYTRYPSTGGDLSGLNRTWYRHGATAARSGKYADMYDAWQMGRVKPTGTKGVMAQESFYQGYLDAAGRRKSNPSDLGQAAFEAGKSWAKSMHLSGVSNANVANYGFSKWFNGLRPGQHTAAGITKIRLKSDFMEGLKVGKRKSNPTPQVAFKLIAGRKFQFENGTRGQEFKWTDLRDNTHGSFDLTMDKKAYNVKGDRPPQVLLKGAFESMVGRSGNPWLGQSASARSRSGDGKFKYTVQIQNKYGIWSSAEKFSNKKLADARVKELKTGGVIARVK